MEDRIIIHGRIMERHPELSPEDIAHAWGARIATGMRLDADTEQKIAVGFDAKGHMVEMAAVMLASGDVLVFHAMTPPSKKTLRETGLL